MFSRYIGVGVSLCVLSVHLSVVKAEQIKLNVEFSHQFLEADKKQTGYLKVSMTGFELDENDRAPLNAALVLDRSGSMEGDKLTKAKEAAIQYVEQLSNDDIVSVVAYDSTVSVLVPATKASDKSAIIQGIRRIGTQGRTALFAGVSKGAHEVRKFFDKTRVNRIVLLSDGLANVGPSSPSDLAQLGLSFMREGIAVTTLGLGQDYNEDLLTQLAAKSDGNHAFVRNTSDLAVFFNKEFESTSDVVAQEVQVTIKCADGIRPVRMLGRDGDITGQIVVSHLNQLCSSQERYVLLEIEVPPTMADTERTIADVQVSYSNMATDTQDLITSRAAAKATHTGEKVAANLSADVMSAAWLQISTLNTAAAIELRDQGKISAAKQALEDNAAFLDSGFQRWKSPDLKAQRDFNVEDSFNLDPAKWLDRRKQILDQQNFLNYQMQF